MLRDAGGLARTLASITGEDHVLTEGAAAAFAVDGVRPRIAVSPGTQQEVEAVVAACGSADAAMTPWGGGTSMSLGNPPARLDVVVRLDRLNRVVEFDDLNLNVSAEAGVRLGDLQKVLKGKREFLPLDPAEADSVSVGGLVQSNASGPGRHLYGSARDWVLGLRVVLPTGERIRCGGKVIKNVSGYDMNKLFIGGFGTMGIVTEATFKLLPVPATRATVVGAFRAVPQLASVVARTLESFLVPEALEALDARALESAGAGFAAGSGYGLAVSLAGSRETVDRQVRDFTKLFADGQATETRTLDAAAAEPAWRAIRDVHAPRKGSGVVVKIAVPIGKTLDLFAAAEGLVARGGGHGAVTAHAGSGIVRAGVDLESGAPLPPFRDALQALRAQAEAAEGSLLLEAAPLPLKRAFDAWGRTRDGMSVTRRLKSELDPGSVMSPGRFVGGI
ncbi:MAG TPA: FAD-binding oxidoreductase [Thermoanaerobaculia bacterium]|nr:FAD-binding oxidoreductase [Thermoanaerobaculia bacterium]